jgi:hypothetical protein
MTFIEQSLQRLPLMGKGKVDRHLELTVSAGTEMDSYECSYLVYTRNGSTDI